MESSPRVWTNRLRRVGGGDLLNNTGLQEVLSEFLPGVLAALADLLVVAYYHWSGGPDPVPVAQLERPIDLVVDCFGVSTLLPSPRRHQCRLACVEYPGSVHGNDLAARATPRH